jgi:hypothetical protein
VYPYFCSLHPSMVGAVVVGDGDGSGAADGTVVQLAEAPIQAEPAAARRAAAGPTAGELAAWRTAALVMFGLLIVTGTLLARRRTGKRSD